MNQEQQSQPVAEAPVQPQQPVQETPMAPQPGAPVQYVVMQQSLHGLGGWLIFWMIFFSLAGIGYVMKFFTALSGTTSADNNIIDLIFGIPLGAGYIAAVVLMALQMKLSIWVSYGVIAVSALSSVISIIMTSQNSTTSANPAMLIGGILVSILLHSLMALYFYASKRVKATLIK